MPRAMQRSRLNAAMAAKWFRIANRYAADSAAYCSGVLPRFFGAAGGVSPGRPGGALTVGIRPPLGLSCRCVCNHSPTTPFAGFASGTISEVAWQPIGQANVCQSRACGFTSTNMARLPGGGAAPCLRRYHPTACSRPNCDEIGALLLRLF
jgi:hypothetical protein